MRVADLRYVPGAGLYRSGQPDRAVRVGNRAGQAEDHITSSEGIVAIDPDTALVLRGQIERQKEAKERLGSDWVDLDLLFTRPDGSALHPADVSDAFAEIVRRVGLPPTTVTMDLYTNVLREVSQATANAIVGIIPRQSKHLPGALGLPSGSPMTTVDREEVKEMALENTKLQVTAMPDLECEGAPSGTRTPNPLVKSQLLCQLS